MPEELQSWIAIGVVAVTLGLFVARALLRRKMIKSRGCASSSCSCPVTKPTDKKKN